MISTVLVTHPWLTTAALAALVVLGPLVGASVVRRPRLNLALLAVAILVVAGLTLSPTGRRLEVGCAVEWSLPTLGAVELVANVILFAPVVLLAGVATRRPGLALVAASGTSALLELLQALVTALGRSCSTNDWLANTLGALLGVVLALAALWLARSVPPFRRGAPTAERESASR